MKQSIATDLFVGLLGLASAATAQTSANIAEPAMQASSSPDRGRSSDELVDIVVTAQRTSERLVETPVAVSAFSGSELAEQQIVDVQALANSIPNFNFGTFAGIPRLAIRGVGFYSQAPGAEGRVAYYGDDVYYSRPATAASDFFDVDRIEVLRGPQGTLYGRNAVGGAVNVFTRDPTDHLSGYYDQTIGNYGQFIEEGAISGPISSAVSGRLAVQIDDRDGYGKNLLTGHDVDNAATQSFRGKIKFDPGGGFSALLSADYHHENDRNFASHYGGQGYPEAAPFEASLLLPISDHGAPAPTNIRDVAAQQDPSNKRDFWGAGLITAYDVNEVTLKSITAYRHSSTENTSGLSTGDAYRTTINENAWQVSQEFQLSGRSSELRWVAGLYGFHERIEGAATIPTGRDVFQESLNLIGIPLTLPIPPNGFLQGVWSGGVGTTDTVAGFGQATYALTPKLELTLGAREAWEEKTISNGAQNDFIDTYTRPNPVTTLPSLAEGNSFYYYQPNSAALTEWSFTPKASLAYKPTQDLNLYGTIAKGYKSGGFDLQSVAPGFKPETLWDYETGFKADVFDHRLRLGLAAFYYHYTNLQVSLVEGTATVTQNAAAARTYGLEGEMEALLLDGLKLTLSGGYLNARLTNYVTSDPALGGAGPVENFKGNHLAQAPDLQGQAGLEYSFSVPGGQLTIRGDVDYTSRVYFTAINVEPLSQGANALENAALNYQAGSGRWHAGLFVRNISNKTVVSSSTLSGFIINDGLVTYLMPPRTYGGTVGVSF